MKHAGRRFLPRALADAEGIVTISCSEWAPGLAEAATALFRSRAEWRTGLAEVRSPNSVIVLRNDAVAVTICATVW